MTKKEEKTIISTFKKEVKAYKFKSKSTFFYKKQDEFFIYVDYFFFPKRTDYNMEYRVYVKKYIYDNIFWGILGMEDNVSCPDSLRAEGAFKAPAVLVDYKELYVQDDIEKIVKDILVDVDNSVKIFLEQHTLYEYIMKYDKSMYNKALKVLTCIDNNMLSEAKSIIDSGIKDGDVGGFGVGGKTFFEMADDYLKKYMKNVCNI